MNLLPQLSQAFRLADGAISLGKVGTIPRQIFEQLNGNRVSPRNFKRVKHEIADNTDVL